MRVLITLTIVSIAAVAYAASAALEPAFPADVSAIDCPAINGDNATLRPDPKNCSKYYTCETGIPISMNCPPGLHFNPRDEACDWPAQACCDKKYWPTEYCKNH